MEANLRKIIDISLDFITLINRDYRYEFVNEAYCRQFGMAREAIEGKTVTELWGAQRFEEKIKRHLDSCLAGQEVHDVDRFRFGNGFKYVQVSYTPYFDGDHVTHAMVYSRDLTTMKELESKIQNMEYKDPVTGLFNSKSFDIVLDMELEKARLSDTDKRRVVLIVELKNFNEVSLQFGPRISDLLLESVGNRIKEALRASDFVFRMEGRTFAVLLTSVAQSAQIGQFADAVAGAVSLPFQHQGQVIQFGCQIGFSVFPDNATEKDVLVRYALSAVHTAPPDGNSVAAFNPDLHQKSLRAERIRADLRQALVEEQLEAYFQPIVDPAKKLVGAEALVRWNHPQLGLISPSEFIPVAEAAGDCFLIDRWMLFRICQYLESWGPKFAGKFVSMNVSARDFAKDSFVDDWKTALLSRKIPHEVLKLEVAETLTPLDLEAASAHARDLRALGTEVFLDGFGTGYSSFSTLKLFPAPVVKLDRSFVSSAAGSPEDRAFLAGMVSLVGNRKPLAVGVESKEQFEVLKTLGVGMFQGFLFSPPVPAGVFEKHWL